MRDPEHVVLPHTVGAKTQPGNQRTESNEQGKRDSERSFPWREHHARVAREKHHVESDVGCAADVAELSAEHTEPKRCVRSQENGGDQRVHRSTRTHAGKEIELRSLA